MTTTLYLEHLRWQQRLNEVNCFSASVILRIAETEISGALCAQFPIIAISEAAVLEQGHWSIDTKQRRAYRKEHHFLQWRQTSLC